MLLEICVQIYFVVFVLSRQIDKQKVKSSSRGGFNPKAPCIRPWF